MVITGGYPIRVLRLSQAGARHVAGWWDGAPVPGNAKARALARRLLDTGLMLPLGTSAVTIGFGLFITMDRSCQAQLLAELLSAKVSIPVRPVLERIRYTTTQTAFDRAELQSSRGLE